MTLVFADISVYVFMIMLACQLSEIVFLLHVTLLTVSI